jgi:hypothetical protein
MAVIIKSTYGTHRFPTYYMQPTFANFSGWGKLCQLYVILSFGETVSPHLNSGSGNNPFTGMLTIFRTDIHIETSARLISSSLETYHSFLERWQWGFVLLMKK